MQLDKGDEGNGAQVLRGICRRVREKFIFTKNNNHEPIFINKISLFITTHTNQQCARTYGPALVYIKLHQITELLRWKKRFKCNLIN